MTRIIRGMTISTLQGFEPFRENVVFLIDAQPAMFEETNLVDSLVCHKVFGQSVVPTHYSSSACITLTGLQGRFLV